MKIFNKQRFQLMNGKQFQKYLVYAIGEIILVIIGILFALGINNWNQKNQLETANLELHKKVLVQLDKDIAYINDFQKDLDTLGQTYRKVLGREYDKSMVNDNGVLSTVLFQVTTLSLDRHLTNLIDNSELDDSKASQELIELNGNFKLYLKNIQDIEDIIFTKITANLEHIEKTQDWYTELITDFVCRNDCINYLLKDEGHKSRIASLRFLYVSGYGEIVEEFKNDLQSSKTDLEALISE
ncbi:hypothetical protein [Psychroserpens ponticola]|uniref:Uncharacterized protein n=1 Tax=Psychroserpens ponticola TaxID=2932268 RepID=A0ABY7S230_9FLAO|nr:hypothetical protein [Psychroserpens ponticola]WCO03193.1 hypothetical protein MUN68_006770 [Psychroserpens ponticola]